MNMIYWNYLLALEEDLEKVSRYIEFSEENFKTYSIELAHLFLAITSELDVIFKEYCKLINSTSDADNINKYFQIINQNSSYLLNETIYCPRFSLEFTPFEGWQESSPPHWWTMYNKVKHHRNTHFKEANLENVLQAMSALLIVNFYFYKKILEVKAGNDLEQKQVHLKLIPNTKLMKMQDIYYYKQIFVDSDKSQKGNLYLEMEK